MTRRVIDLPPETTVRPNGDFAGGWWRDDDDGRILCELCPRACRLKTGDRGFCFVRQNVDGELVLTTYGKSTGFCIDPIEKKPLNHFLPGTSVLSFGTAGCNLGCRFCQNWDISKSRQVERLSEIATPEMIAAAAAQHDCHSVAFTYNDPVIWAEYAIDTAKACHDLGIKTVAVTTGYISPKARAPFFHVMDAANVDLKAFQEEFYYELTGGHLKPVLETLEWLKKESDVWFEITNLIIPKANDSDDELRRLCDWVLDRIGDDTPIHFSAFHPDFRMADRDRTPHETLLNAKKIAEQQGLKFAYVGNVDDVQHQSTHCPSCSELLIERNWYELGQYHLDGSRCGHCQATIAGRFEKQPGNWGRQRLPIQIAQFTTAKTSREKPANVDQVSKPLNQNCEQEMSSSSDSSNVPVLPDLTNSQESAIHLAASEHIVSCVNHRAAKLADPTLGGANENPVMGAFVTLKRQGRLRACCGSLGVPMPLGKALANAAQRTALEDHRLPTISPTELAHLDLDVTLLYAFEPIQAQGEARAKEVEIGKHGLQIRRGEKGGLLLPSVATEYGYSAEDFLRQVCRKAGLPNTAWLDNETHILRFQGHSIPGLLDNSQLGDRDREAPRRFDSGQIEKLAEHCRANIAANLAGGTPNYYATGAADGDVLGVVLTVGAEGLDEPIQVGNLGMRKSVPLQASLNQYCEQAARGLALRSLAAAQPNVQVAILTDSAMHGTASMPDLRGFDPATRCLVVSSGDAMKWVFDPSKTAQSLLQSLEADLNCGNSEIASIHSFHCETTGERAEFTNVPKPFAGPDDRPAAVAGTFYPDNSADMNRVVSRLVSQDAAKSSHPAVMVPHAGLVYSGGIAGETLSAVEIPNLVIVIGPKHTRNGVNWAVAPHGKWLIPGGAVPSDPNLARQLAESIPGLQLDAAAHAREHAIEVELPLIHALAPDARVIGIVMGAATLEQAREFAAGLAEAIRNLDETPLLVISSDMNHYGEDKENRRLDALALEAMETMDTEKLFSTCRDHNISMCGLLPAIVVMETLKKLDQLSAIKRLGYATSADASGDKSRVVGYAGALLG